MRHQYILHSLDNTPKFDVGDILQTDLGVDEFHSYVIVASETWAPSFAEAAAQLLVLVRWKGSFRRSRRFHGKHFSLPLFSNPAIFLSRDLTQ